MNFSDASLIRSFAQYLSHNLMAEFIHLWRVKSVHNYAYKCFYLGHKIYYMTPLLDQKMITAEECCIFLFTIHKGTKICCRLHRFSWHDNAYCNILLLQVALTDTGARGKLLCAMNCFYWLAILRMFWREKLDPRTRWLLHGQQKCLRCLETSIIESSYQFDKSHHRYYDQIATQS